MLLAVAASLSALSARAQLTYNFVVSLGASGSFGGSFTLNTNNLVFTGGDGSAAGYHDTLDSLTFDGFTYTNLNFSVYNNSYIVNFRDGFQILAKDSFGDPILELDVAGNSSVVSGVTPADLVMVLNNFDALKQSGNFTAGALYNEPYAPHKQLVGSVTSFQLVATTKVSGIGVHGNQFGFDIAGTPGATAIVEVCTGLPQAGPVWSPVQTNTLTSGPWHFSDPGWTNHSQQFYRIRTQ